MSTSECSTDPIDAAIESAESLIASLLTKDRVGSSVTDGAGDEDQVLLDPEQSLFPPSSDQQHSLVTEGSAPLFPTPLTATSQVTFPEYHLDSISPRESLHALVSKVSVTSEHESLDFNALQRLLYEREKDLEVAAKIGQRLLERNESLEVDLAKMLEHKQSVEQQLKQMQHAMARKEELLRLYASEQDEQSPAVSDSKNPNPNWVQVLTEECKELRESNIQLQEEADMLRKETADVELKEKELVQQCLEQFTEAKRRLSVLREESELKNVENNDLQSKLVGLNDELLKVHERWQQQMEEVDILKEQFSASQDHNHQLSQTVAELQDKLDDMAVLLKEAKDENGALKESYSLPSLSSSGSDPTQVEHESIVHEIEEALRKEIIAASTLPERPRSPDHYARQRTMVVMETVRAATLASARRRERLAAKLAKPSLPLASSSPSTGSKSKASPSINPPSICPPSPILPGNSGSLQQVPEELVRYRNQTYVAPEKLQIVKPLEGSMTLLKWKLLASPQLGGATSFFSNAAGPGVHMKKWRAGGVIDENSQSSLAGSRIKSLSTADMDSLNYSSRHSEWAPPSTAFSGGLSVSMDTGQQHTAAAAAAAGGKNPGTSHSTLAVNHMTATSPNSSKGIMDQVGSFLGSRLGFGASNSNGSQTESSALQDTNQNSSTGLSVLLDS